MNPISIVSFYNENTFIDIPQYTITQHNENEFRIEWEPYYTGDIDLERWMILSFNKVTHTLFIEFEYNTFQFYISNYDFNAYFNLFIHNIEEFVSPLNKKLAPSIEDSLILWENTAFSFFLDEKISEQEYINILNFFREKCYLQVPSIVIENIMLSSPLLTSLFKDPVSLFPVLYNYPVCTKFFLKYIVPLLYELIIHKKILN